MHESKLFLKIFQAGSETKSTFLQAPGIIRIWDQRLLETEGLQKGNTEAAANAGSLTEASCIAQ